VTSAPSPSLWSSTIRGTVEAPPLAREASVDLAIIGGGFTGCAAALQAARRGASVCLLEAGEIGAGASGRNVGLVNAGLWLRPQSVLAAMGPEAGRRLIDCLAAAPARVFGLIEAEGIACEAVTNGSLHLAHAPSGLRDLRIRHAQGREIGAPLMLLDAAGTAARTGSAAFAGALFDPRAGTIQPLAYCRGLARAAQRAGARIHGGSRVTALGHAQGVWTLQANGHRIRAAALLLATNAYHHAAAGVVPPSFATVPYAQFATPVLPDAARATILPGGEGCWDTARVMSSFRMDRAGRLILGGIGKTGGVGAGIHHAWARRKLRTVFPQLADMPFEHAWTGRIAMTGDHIPRIVAFGPGGLACYGYSGRGIGPGTVFGQQAAEALLSGDMDLLPMRPVTAHRERLTRLRSAVVDLGATLTHLLPPLQRL